MGPSGSGQIPPLMYCLAGLDQPTSGQVSLNGTDLASQSRKALAEMRRGELGFVFQSYNLVPTLTAYENVAFAVPPAGETSEGAAHRRHERGGAWTSRRR